MSYHASAKGRPKQDGLTMLTEETIWGFIDRVLVADS